MDRLIVTRKLESLRRCLARVREKCPDNEATLAADPDLQDIVVLNLSCAMQLCVDLALHVLSGAGNNVPETMGQEFDQLAASGALPADLAQRLKKERALSAQQSICRAASNRDLRRSGTETPVDVPLTL